MSGWQCGDFRSPDKKKVVLWGFTYNVCEVQSKIYSAATAVCHKLNIQEMCELKLLSLTYRDLHLHM